jgi:hypothetical protein
MDETDSKQPKIRRKMYQPMDFINLKKKSANQKSRDFCQIFVISNKKIHRLGNGFKNLNGIYRLPVAYGFLFFVISIGFLFFVISISGEHGRRERRDGVRGLEGERAQTAQTRQGGEGAVHA